MAENRYGDFTAADLPTAAVARLRAYQTNLMRRFVQLGIMAFLPGFVLAAPLPDGSAEQSAPAVDSQSLDDIVVTAQRRAERLQDVPISIQAISAGQAENFNLRTVKDLQLITPGLTFSTPYAYSQIYIRGIGTIFANPGLETSVSVYVDGLYLERQLGTIFDLIDPGTTEVLKGPQGSLYGRNATGGVILLNSANPTDKSEGSIALEGGRFDHAQMDAMLNEPLNDQFRLRVAARAQSDGGFTRNDFDGRELGGGKTYDIRGKLEWIPADNVTILLTSEYRWNEASGTPVTIRAGAPSCLVCAIVPGVQPAPGRYETNQNTDSDALTNTFATSVKTNISIGSYDFASVVGFRRLTWTAPLEVDGTAVPFFFYEADTGGKTYSADFQMSSRYEGPFNFLTGVSLEQDDGFFKAGLGGLAFSPLPVLRNDSDVRTRVAAYFAEGTYAVTSRLKLTVGGRYNFEEKTLTAVNLEPAPLVFGSAGFTDSNSFNSFTPRAVVAYDTDLGNVYFSVSRGFKSGGFNVPAFTPEVAVGPEKVTNYELGAKLKVSDRASLNLAIFHYDYNDLQVTITDFARGGSFLENAATARGNGAEADLLMSVASELTASVGGAYLDAKYRSFTNAQIYVLSPTGVGLSASEADLSGTDLPRAPRFTGHVALAYDKEIWSGWSGNLSAIANYTSSFLLSADAGGPLQNNYQGGYSIVNLTGYVSPPGKRLRVGFYVDNLTNRAYYLDRDTSQYGLTGTFAKPISYGVRLSYRY